MADPEIEELPAETSWRELDQDVNPRTLSSHGRRRLAVAVGQMIFLTLLGCAALWGAWEVGRTLTTNTTVVNDPLNTTPLREVVVITDGMLTKAWVENAMKLPKRTPFLDLELVQLRDRLLAHGQIRSVEIRRQLPDTLIVTLVERTPVVQMKVQFPGAPLTRFLVARDGVVYEGAGYAEAKLAELPYLDGVRLVARKQGGIYPIAGMAEASALLLAAQQNTPDLYRDWRVVNLGRLASHEEIVVRARDIPEIVFTSSEDYAKQLGYLAGVYQRVNVTYRDYELQRIDLSLGSQVPVSFKERAGLTAQTSLKTNNPRPRRDF